MSSLIDQLRTLPEPAFPGDGETASRHAFLMNVARRNLPLARLAEAIFDALAILKETGHSRVPGALYGVWASEIPGQTVASHESRLSGRKRFCSGAGLLDRALVTVTSPEGLIDVDLRKHEAALTIDSTEWSTEAFSDTSTATVSFNATPFETDEVVSGPGGYLGRPGFWSGAIGPAACWAGGAIGLVDWALRQRRKDPHTLAHLGALEANAWNLRSTLAQAGDQIDEHPHDFIANRRLAFVVRHVVESACADILKRLGRAYGPHPLAFDREVNRRYQEVELYIRQCHAERDLESLGALCLETVRDCEQTIP